MPTHRLPSRIALHSWWLHAALLASALWLAAAGPAQAAPPVAYSKDGVTFELPAGWTVAEDTVAQDGTRLRSIDIEGPGEAIVSFMLSPFLAGQDIEKFAATAARNRAEAAARASATPQARMGPVTTTAITRQVAGTPQQGVSQRFVVSLLGQDLPHEARFFKAALAGTTVIVMTQVSDDSAKAAEPGFAMALGTLRYGAAKR